MKVTLLGKVFRWKCVHFPTFSSNLHKMCTFSSNLHKMHAFSFNLHKMCAFFWKCTHFHLICIKCEHFLFEPLLLRRLTNIGLLYIYKRPTIALGKLCFCRPLLLRRLTNIGLSYIYERPTIALGKLCFCRQILFDYVHFVLNLQFYICSQNKVTAIRLPSESLMSLHIGCSTSSHHNTKNWL